MPPMNTQMGPSAIPAPVSPPVLQAPRPAIAPKPMITQGNNNMSMQSNNNNVTPGIVGPTANPSPLRNVNPQMRDMSPQASTIATMPSMKPSM